MNVYALDICKSVHELLGQNGFEGSWNQHEVNQKDRKACEEYVGAKSHEAATMLAYGLSEDDVCCLLNIKKEDLTKWRGNLIFNAALLNVTVERLSNVE